MGTGRSERFTRNCFVVTRRLRIAMISYYLPSGSKIGVGYQVHNLASEMVHRGHDVTVYSACPPVDGATYKHELVELSGALRTFRFATALRRLSFRSYDVLHAHGDDYWMWRRRTGAHIRTLHGSCFEEALHIRGFVQRLRMFALGWSEVLASLVSDVAVVVSPGTRRWTPWVRQVIPNGVDTAQFYPDEARRSLTPAVLFVGTWSGRKRGELLAEAFVKSVLPRIPDAQLWMVTNDVPEGVHPSIRERGRLTDAELADLYRQAWVFCLPSSYEGFGVPYIEAMASGLAVVATPNVGARYVTDEGTFGVLANVDELGDAVASLLADPIRRATLATAGLERVNDFSLRSVAERYEAVYAVELARRD
jgi:phosphatidyl-myo-inositol alpha-mannosyltransferase